MVLVGRADMPLELPSAQGPTDVGLALETAVK